MTHRAVASRSFPPLRHAAAAIALSALLLLVVPALARASSLVNFNRETYAYATTLSAAQEAGRYQVMVMQATNASKAATLKAANPNLRILMYSHSWEARISDPTGQSTCTDEASDVANHPSWILHDQYGNPVLASGGNYLMDVGNPAYQAACVAHAVALAKQDGFDGVWFDGIVPSLGGEVPSGTTVPEYPTPASWQAAMTSFVNTVGPALRSNGLLVVGNMCGVTTQEWQQWTTPLDGGEEESFTDGSYGLAQQIPWWSQKLANVAWSEAHGKYALLHSYNTTEAGDTYGLASMLLVANGESSWSTSNIDYGTSETWWPEYGTAQQLGAPVGPYTRLPNGVYWRWFQNGIVVVNPTANTVPSFSLGGTTYTGSGLTSASSLSMPPTSGYVLLDDNPGAMAAPAATASAGISLTPIVGSTITAAPSFSGSPAPTYTFQWKRCNWFGCSLIAGATSQSYKVTSADIGDWLQTDMTAINSAGSVSATSPLSAAVPTPTFTLSTTTPTITVPRWISARYPITVNDVNGFTGPVTFSYSGSVPGWRPGFNALSSATGTLFSIGTSASSVGTWPVTVTATAGGQTATIKLTLIVT